MLEADLKSARGKIDDYEFTALALLGFSAFIVHDGKDFRRNSHFSIGRRMRTSGQNAVVVDGDVTPDLVAQASETYGVVVEAKVSLPQDKGRWPRHLKQLRKYDDRLIGWWTSDESIATANVVALVEQGRSRAFCKMVREQVSADPSLVGANTCVVEFNRSDQAQPYLFFRSEYGQVLDPDFEKLLADGKKVPLEKILISFPSLKFYDARPPMLYLLSMLWTDVVPARLEEGRRNEATGATDIDVDPVVACRELQAAYGSGRLEADDRSVEFPTQTWVTDAFEVLVRLRLASRVSGAALYTVHWRRFRDDVLETFLRMAGKKKLDLLTTGVDDSDEEDDTQRAEEEKGQLALELTGSAGQMPEKVGAT